MTELERQLIQDIKETTSSYHKALSEYKLWCSQSPDVRRQFAGNGNGCIAKITGETSYSIKFRAHILNTPGTHNIWPLLDAEEITLIDSSRVIKEASALASKKNLSMEEAIELVLPKHCKKNKKRRAKKTKPLASTSGNGHNFWPALRKTISEYIESKIPEGSVIDHEPIKKSLEIDLRALCDEYINRIARRSIEVETVSRGKLNKACAVLHLDPPRGKKFDLTRAKKQKKLLARAYHPDANGGDESLRLQYEAVLEAYLVVESWYLQRESK